jgi:hypothetical protein
VLSPDIIAGIIRIERPRIAVTTHIGGTIASHRIATGHEDIPGGKTHVLGTEAVVLVNLAVPRGITQVIAVLGIDDGLVKRPGGQDAFVQIRIVLLIIPEGHPLGLIELAYAATAGHRMAGHT